MRTKASAVTASSRSTCRRDAESRGLGGVAGSAGGAAGSDGASAARGRRARTAAPDGRSAASAAAAACRQPGAAAAGRANSGVRASSGMATIAGYRPAALVRATAPSETPVRTAAVVRPVWTIQTAVAAASTMVSAAGDSVSSPRMLDESWNRKVHVPRMASAATRCDRVSRHASHQSARNRATS